MAPQKILIIDDEPLIRHTTELLMKRQGLQPVSAANGPEGIRMAESEKPDLILLDIMMPGMDGWDVLLELQNREGLNDIPVIIFTAVDYTISDSKAAEMGAAGVLRKPFHLNQLMRLIERIGGKA